MFCVISPPRDLLPLIIIVIDIFYKDCQIVRTNSKALLDEKQTKRKNKNKKKDKK